MDQAQLQQKIAEYYEKLPPLIQAAFSGMTWIESLKEMSILYDLNSEQESTLGTETTLVLLGIIPLEEYESNLTKELKINKELEEKLMKDIKDKIIEQIRPQLINAYDENVNSLFDEDIPLPPTQIEETLTPIKAVKNSQAGIFKDAGIEMVVDRPMNPIEEKMTGMTISKKTVKDYTLPKMNTQKGTDNRVKSGDPYHESIN
jgi:hypothetical protein